MQNNSLNSFKEYFNKFISSSTLLIVFLLFIKVLFQIIILSSGYRWLSADDYCRTIKSYEWLQNPEISAGVWLSPHFWLEGFFMIFIKDLFWAALTVNFIFSFFTLIYFYKAVELSFNKFIAFFSTLIFCFFPFQVWLSISGLPESVFFFFITAGIYYFLKWKKSGSTVNSYLILCAASFALSNCFRYEGWLFSATLVFLVALDFFKDRKFSKEFIKNVLLASISGITIIWWLIQNYIDHKDVMFFAKETTKIFEQFDKSSFFQRLVQYPTFILYIAPFTTVFAFKKIYDTFRGKNHELAKYFALFNLIQLLLLIFHGMAGTGGTNMVSRYIVMNALLFVPFAIQQCYEIKKYFAIPILAGFVIINIIWSFYYPQPFREDTFEVGNLLKSQFERGYVKPEGKVYFEEVDGYFDIWAIKTLSNSPDKFLLGNLDTLIAQNKRKLAEKNSELKAKSKIKKSDNELNILDVKTYLDDSKIQIAIVRSESFIEKLKKLSLKNEEIGDYKIYYITDRSNYLNDSTFSIFKEKIISLKENPEQVNYNKTLALKKFEIDNSNFGLNPQTITLEWGATDRNIIDSLDYANFDFERYKSIVNIKPVDKDSVVFTIENRIFSDRNIEDLIDNNTVRNIVVLKPFAMLQYSSVFGKPPFESGVYNLELKLRDTKSNKDMILYRGDSLYKYEIQNIADTSKLKVPDSLKNITKKIAASKDSILTGYNMGSVIAMFPNTDYNKLVKKSSTDIYQTLMKNGLQVFFSQRYQGDHFLNWVFNYF